MCKKLYLMFTSLALHVSFSYCQFEALNLPQATDLGVTLEIQKFKQFIFVNTHSETATCYAIAHIKTLKPEFKSQIIKIDMKKDLPPKWNNIKVPSAGAKPIALANINNQVFFLMSEQARGWFGYYTQYSIYSFNDTTWQKIYTLPDKFHKPLSFCGITQMGGDNIQEIVLWINTLDEKNNEKLTYHVKLKNDIPIVLPHNALYSVITDNRANLWSLEKNGKIELKIAEIEDLNVHVIANEPQDKLVQMYESLTMLAPLSDTEAYCILNEANINSIYYIETKSKTDTHEDQSDLLFAQFTKIEANILKNKGPITAIEFLRNKLIVAKGNRLYRYLEIIPEELQLSIKYVQHNEFKKQKIEEVPTNYFQFTSIKAPEKKVDIVEEKGGGYEVKPLTMNISEEEPVSGEAITIKDSQEKEQIVKPKQYHFPRHGVEKFKDQLIHEQPQETFRNTPIAEQKAPVASPTTTSQREIQGGTPLGVYSKLKYQMLGMVKYLQGYNPQFKKIFDWTSYVKQVPTLSFQKLMTFINPWQSKNEKKPLIKETTSKTSQSKKQDGPQPVLAK